MQKMQKKFDETKYMSFFTKDEKLLKAYNNVLDKVNNIMQKGFDSEPLHSEKYLKTKIKFFSDKINTHFYDNWIPKVVSHCGFLSVILITTVVKMGKNYYPQIFIEEGGYIVKEMKMNKFINNE